MFESFKFECMSLNDILPYTRLALIKFKELFPSAPILIVSDYDYKWGGYELFGSWLYNKP